MDLILKKEGDFLKIKRILCAVLVFVMALGVMSTVVFAATDGTVSDDRLPCVVLNDAGNAVTTDMRGSWATRVYWGYIGEEEVEYNDFDEFRLMCGLTYSSDFAPRDKKVYNFSQKGYYRFVLKCIVSGTDATNYKYKDTVYTFHYDGSSKACVPTLKIIEGNTVQIEKNGLAVTKLYYGKYGDSFEQYVWFNDFWGKALGTKTYVVDFGVTYGEQYKLPLKGFYNFVIVYNDANGKSCEVVYTVEASEDSQLIKKVEGEAKAVVDLSQVDGSIAKVYYGCIGDENIPYTNYNEFKAQCGDTFKSVFSVKDGMTFDLDRDGYYRFVVQYKTVSFISGAFTDVIYDRVFTVKASDNSAPITDPTFVIENVTASAGDTGVELAVSAVNNPGVAGMTVSLEYDDTALTLSKISTGDVLSGLTFQKPKTYKNGCNLVWYGSEPNDVIDGTAFVLKFDISDGAPAGTYPVKLTFTDGTGVDLEPVTFDVVNGSVVIK